MKSSCILQFFLLGLVGVSLTNCGGNVSDGSISPPSGEPLIGVSTDTLDFGFSGVERSLIIYNTGGGTLLWNLYSWPYWLIDPEVYTGSLGISASDTVILQIDRTFLDPGENVGTLHLSSNGGSLVLTVRADLSAGPVLGEMPDTLDFGALQDSLELTIYSAGQDTLHWTISADDPWFSASPASGTTAEQSTVWVVLDREEAPDGSLQSFLHVSSDGGDDQIRLLALVGDFEGQWLSYCGDADGYYAAQYNDYFFIVRFDRPQDWEDFKISRIRIQLHTLPNAYDQIQLRCWSVVSDGGFLFPDLFTSGLLYQSAALNPSQGWNEWTVDWPLELSTFCVGYYQYDYLGAINPDPYYDSSYPVARSYIVWEQYMPYFVLDLLYDREWCLEVFVEPIFTASGFTSSKGMWLKPFAGGSSINSQVRPEPLARRIVTLSGD